MLSVTRYWRHESRHLIAVIAVSWALLMVACSSPDSPPPAVTAAAAEIAWYEGTTEEAFAIAESGNQPLFLYWGASWCPYCKQIEATVFRQRDVLDRMSQFVAVKLDGDAPSAQKLGEEFGIFGYPTMIVFAPDGTELTRIPNGLNPEAYSVVLDLALDSVEPLSDIVNELLAGQEVQDNDWHRLSMYSWQQDNNRLRADRSFLETLATISERCPDSVRRACSRLYFAYLTEQVNNARGAPFSDSSKRLAYARLMEMIADPALLSHNIDTILYSWPDYLGAVTDAGSPERTKLRSNWQAVSIRLAEDASLSIVDRLYARYVPIGLYLADSADVPAPDLESLRQHVEAALARTVDSTERHAVVMTASTVLIRSGLTGDAKDLLLKELANSSRPFYLMSNLAYLAENEGDHSDALQWRQKAYGSSIGENTRFRWGYKYVLALLRMSPDDVTQIETVATAMFKEIKDPETAFFGDTYSVASELNVALADWADDPDRRAAVLRIRVAVNAICERITSGQTVRQRCDSLFAGLES